MRKNIPFNLNLKKYKLLLNKQHIFLKKDAVFNLYSNNHKTVIFWIKLSKFALNKIILTKFFIIKISIKPYFFYILHCRNYVIEYF